MGLYLNRGNSAFEIALNSKIYVDKTGLLAYANDCIGSNQRFLCVSRPRRFGKSITAEMLEAYYCRSCDSSAMFAPLEISQSPSFQTYLNQYDVLFLEIQRLMSRAGGAKELVPYLQRKVLQELRRTYPALVEPEETNLSAALEAIYHETGNGFVIIIDEWDCLFREQQSDIQAQRVYLDFLRELLKGQVYVRLAYMTGILPIKKYGTHSALNMFEEFSMTSPKRLAEYVGFTEQEVQTLCEQYHMDFAETQRWYDGYHLGEIDHVYNPKSVVDAMLNREFQSYWTATETYEALKVYIDLNFDGLKDAITMMMGGGRSQVNPRRFQNDMTTFTSKDDVLTLLVHLGYLSYDGGTETVMIPNMEVLDEFALAVEGPGWSEVANAIRASNTLLKATLAQDEQAVAAALDAIHMEHTSVLSYNNELSLSCVITLAYYSARKDYTLIREFPTGKGFADIVFLPRHHTDLPAIIVELKWNRSAEGAIQQTKEREYVTSLRDYRGNILLVGINYDKSSKTHSCIIERVKK